MSVARIKELPYPEKKFESHEDAWEYCKELRNSLQEEQSERVEDFDVLKIDNMGWEDVRGYAKNVKKKDGLANAISKIGSTETTLLISNQQDVTDNATVPSTMTLRFLQGGSLNISSTKTVTINGHVEAGLFQIFEGSGTVSFGTGSIEKVYSEWWGADNSGSTSSTSAFNAMLASGCLRAELCPGASYKIKDVTLPQISGFSLNGNWATIIPDEGAGTPDTCFSGTVIATIKNYTIEKMFISGNVTDFIKITQTDPSGFMLYWYLQDFYTVNGTGSSIVKLINDTASNSEGMYIKRITALDPALFDHILFMTYTSGHVGFGTVVCEDFYLNEGTSVGQCVVYTDVAANIVTNGRFRNIFGTRGNIVDLNAVYSRFENIYMEASEDDCTVMTGIYRSCTIDGLTQQNAIPSTYTGDELFDGTMISTSVWNAMHLRVGESIGSDIVVILSADSEFSYWNTLFDGYQVDYPETTPDYHHWASVTDSGSYNTFETRLPKGDWLPIDGSGASLVLTVAGQSTYTKTLRHVWASCRITYPATADGTSANIGGLPYTITNNLGNSGGGVVTLSSLGTAITVLPIQNTTTLGFYKIGGAAYTNAELSGKLIIFSVQYQTDTW